MSDLSIAEAMQLSKDYIDGLTIRSAVNRPAEVVADEHRFFSWDNEKRTPSEKPYLFDWSYYNGVVMEGLFDVCLAKPAQKEPYLAYIREYLNGLIEEGTDGAPCLSRRLAGYVDHHGADCYRTAALMVRFAADNGLSPADERCRKISAALYRDLTDETWRNSKGNIVALDFTEKDLGGNYWHSWAGGNHPRYKLWLDGLYMIQPFLARYAALIGDSAQQDRIVSRLLWVSENMLAENGLYFHACSGRGDVCNFFWLRAIGWYGMALVDVMEALPPEKAAKLAPALETFVTGMLSFQEPESGMWANLVDQPVTQTNRLETSGTSMLVYTILKGVRLGYLEEAYKGAALQAFTGMVSLKLKDNVLADIYLKATASGQNNYEYTDYYMPDEGKGSGPFIMAYSELLYL